jgi:hypothetical protein
MAGPAGQEKDRRVGADHETRSLTLTGGNSLVRLVCWLHWSCNSRRIFQLPGLGSYGSTSEREIALTGQGLDSSVQFTVVVVSFFNDFCFSLVLDIALPVAIPRLLPLLCHPYPEICIMNGPEDVAYHKSTCVGPRQGQDMVSYYKILGNPQKAHLLWPSCQNEQITFPTCLACVIRLDWLFVVWQILLEGSIKIFTTVRFAGGNGGGGRGGKKKYEL